MDIEEWKQNKNWKKNVEIGEEKQGNIDIKINNREQKGSAMDRSTLCIYSFWIATWYRVCRWRQRGVCCRRREGFSGLPPGDRGRRVRRRGAVPSWMSDHRVREGFPSLQAFWGVQNAHTRLEGLFWLLIDVEILLFVPQGEHSFPIRDSNQSITIRLIIELSPLEKLLVRLKNRSDLLYCEENRKEIRVVDSVGLRLYIVKFDHLTTEFVDWLWNGKFELLDRYRRRSLKVDERV